MKKTLRVERLARREERATVKRIFYLTVVSLILAFFLFTLGTTILGKFADFLETIFGGDEETSLASGDTPRPPKLDDLPSATNSANLTVSGFSDEGTVVIVYLNSDKAGEVKAADGKFQYEGLNLIKGENNVSALAEISGKQSESSSVEVVILDQEEPKLEIDTPADGQSFSQDNRIRVSGKTDPDSQVYANGFLANVDRDAKFEVFVPIAEGESAIDIKAVDEAGNTKIEKRKVTFRK